MNSKGTVLIITLLELVVACHSISNLYEPEKEYIYNYNAKINVGTFKPAIFASQFMLDGKLHVQNNEKSLFMRLSDLSFKLYNGELNQHDEYEPMALPLPTEAEDLLKPFQMHYEKGKMENFASNIDDHKFSTNMKKAIGSLMQLDLSQMKFDAKLPYAFITNENSIYGDVVARYNIMPDESEMIVQKMLDVQSSKHWMAYFGITNTDRYEDMADRSAISIDSHREYKLLKEEHGYYINTIDSQGGIFSHMMKGFTETQFMYVNQTLHFAKKIPISEKMSLTEEKSIVDDLNFEIEADESEETIFNLSFGRSEIKMETLENLIDGILNEVVAHTKMEKLNVEPPEIKQGQGINRLHRLMAMLDIAAFEKMFLHLQEQPNMEKFVIFREMIPLIGTRASIKFVRNLIRKQKVDEDVAVSMLQKMPFHLQMPSGKLLTEVEDLMNLEKVTPNVHKAAVLSFATLIYKTYSHYMIQNNLVKPIIKEDLLEKYIVKYMELLKSSQDYSSQYLYIHGLYNIQIGNVMKYLEPYVKGEATSNQHLRYLAMCASYIEVIKDSKYAFEVYWPIFADTTLSLELRVGAYITLMTTKPSPEKLYDMYWILKRDPNSELYNFHYTYLKSLTNTQDSSLQGYRTAEILNFMRAPYRQVVTGNYMADYKDPKYGFAALNNMMLQSTNTSKSIYIDFGTNMYNYQVMNYGLWLKIDGIDSSEFLNWSNDDWKDQMKTILTKCKEQNKVHVEYALLHNDKTIQLNYIECKDYEKLLMEIMQYLEKSTRSISYELIMQQIMPNDLGMPSVFEIFIPNLMNNQMLHVPLKEGTDRQTHWKFQRSSHTKIGISFYNPIVDIWQGAERIQANEIIGDMSFSNSMDKSGKMKFAIYNQNDDTRDKFAMRNYATIVTYVYKDVNNVLQKSSKNSEHFAKVSRGKQYRKSALIFEYDCPHTGLHFTIDVFDTKRHVSLKTILEYAQRSMKKHLKNYETMPYGYMLLILQNAAHQIILSPECGTFGLMIRATPSKLYPVDQVEILFHQSSERMMKENTLKMLRKFNFETSLTTHGKENKVLNQWGVDGKFVVDMDHSLENYNIHYRKMAPEAKTYEVCMRGTREIMNNKMIIHHNITMSHSSSTSDDEMCSHEENSILIKTLVEQSDEQLDMIKNNMVYDECMSKHMHDPHLNGLKINYNKGMDCIEMKTSLRKYTFDIQRNSTSYDYKAWLAIFHWYYSNEKMNNVLDENTMKLIVEYPLIGDEISVQIMEKHMNHKLMEMPIYFLKHLGLHPQNYYYSNKFMKLKHMKMIDSCLIADHHIFNNHEELIKIIDDEWMRVVYSDPSHTNKNAIVVFVKQMGKQMALKVKIEENILEIIPDNDHYKITLNGKPLILTKDSYLEEKLFYIGMLDDKENTIIMNMFNYPFYINYDGENIEMHKKVTDISLIGTCFMH